MFPKETVLTGSLQARSVSEILEKDLRCCWLLRKVSRVVCNLDNVGMKFLMHVRNGSIHLSPVAFFQPRYRSNHPEIYLFLLSKKKIVDQSIRKTFNLILKEAALLTTAVQHARRQKKSQMLFDFKFLCYVVLPYKVRHFTKGRYTSDLLL